MAQAAPIEIDARSSGPAAFRARGFILGFLLCIPVAYISPTMPQSAMFSLLVAPVGLLLFLVVLNSFLRKLNPKAALTQSDLILIYAITTVAASTGGEWLNPTHPLIHLIPHQENANPIVKSFMVPHLPDWLVVKDLEQVKDISGGGKDLNYTLSKLPIYFPRYLGWGVMIISACMAMLCINSLMRGAWTRREKLSFPLIQLPVALTENGGAGSMWKSRYLWIAFGIMFAIDMLNGFNYLFPNLPAIPVKEWARIDTLFKDLPWSNMGEFRIALYPFMAAIGIFMPSDLIFSIVLFYLLRVGTHLILASNGIPQETFSGTFVQPGPPYFDEQTWGGVLALFVGAIWVSRGYLKEVWRDIRTGQSAEDGGIRHRWAFVGLLVCFGILVGYGLVGQLPLYYLIPYVALFLVFSTVLTRMRAQLGPPSHEFAFLGPNSIMSRFLGNQWMTDKQATWINAVFLWMNRIHRTHPMPHQLESMKIGEQEGVRPKLIFWGLAGATVIGFFATMFFLHANAYYLGSPTRSMDSVWFLTSFTSNRHGPDVVGILMTLFGFGMVVALDAVRFRFPGFPLHPAGYVLSMNYGVDYYWFGLLLVMIVKNFVQRYYGLRGYDKLRHVALGILVAEYGAETIWMLFAMITHQSSYTISFNDRSLGIQ